MTPVDLGRERWLRLVRVAHVAVETGQADHLARLANQLREVPSPVDGPGRAACQAFRWACLWFAHAEPGARPGLCPLLLRLAEQLEALIAPPSPDPVAVGAAVAPVDPRLAWTTRADIGG